MKICSHISRRRQADVFSNRRRLKVGCKSMLQSAVSCGPFRPAWFWAVGVIFGLVAAWGLSRVLRSVLVQVTAADPATFISITILLTVVTIIACLVPSRRAMRLDPVDALRTE